MSGTLFTWIVDQQSLSSFAKSKAAKCWKSCNFSVSNTYSGKSNFQLICYPIGMNDDRIGSFDIMLFLNQMQSDIAEMTLKFSILCVETLSQCRDVFCFSKTNRSYIWPKNCMSHSEVFYPQNPSSINSNNNQASKAINILMKSMSAGASATIETNMDFDHRYSQLTFECELDILQIVCKPVVSLIGKCLYENSIQIDQHLNYEWNINNKTIEHTLRNAQCGKILYSNTFNVWCLYLAVNGFDIEQNENCTFVGLQLLQLPSNIYSIIVQAKLYCTVFNNSDKQKSITFEWNMRHSFTYVNNLIVWPSSTMPFDIIHNLKQNIKHSMIIGCDIQVLNIYDINKKSVPEYEFYKYFIQYSFPTEIQPYFR